MGEAVRVLVVARGVRGGAWGVRVGVQGEGYGARGERVPWREGVGRPPGRQGTPILALTLVGIPILALTVALALILTLTLSRRPGAAAAGRSCGS